MLGTTRRQRAAAALALAIGAGSATTALLGHTRIALAGLAALATVAFLVALATRTRLIATDQRLRTRERAERRSASNSVLQDRIGELESQVLAAQEECNRLDDLGRASYRQSLRQHVRAFRAENKLHARNKSAALQLPYKLRNIELAASHGIDVPEIYQVWPDLDSIDLTCLPERFVLKADGGAGSVAVFPLQRIADGTYRAVGAQGQFTSDTIRDSLRSLGNRARAPYFAEELLLGTEDTPIPNDVKLYMFYGEVGHILVRNVGEHGRASSIRLKFVDESGNDFGAVAVGRSHDSSILVPDSLSDLTRAARHLSRAVGLPFCRVDLYETSRKIVFGELTRAPSGGNEHFLPAHDEFLGDKWLGASARLAVDLNAGRPIGPLFGKVRNLRLYPESTSPRSPGNFERTIADCSLWCQ